MEIPELDLLRSCMNLEEFRSCSRSSSSFRLAPRADGLVAVWGGGVYFAAEDMLEEVLGLALLLLC